MVHAWRRVAILPEEKGKLIVWDAVTGKVIQELAGVANGLAFSDGALLAAGDEEGAIKLWSLPDGKEVGSFKTGARLGIRSLALARMSGGVSTKA